jgi:hypothetical protein
MAALILGPMLRHVGETSATVWVETDTPCTVQVAGAEARTFSVEGRHYALVLVEGLPSAATTPYDVRLDGEVQWPIRGSRLPPSTIRTFGAPGGTRIVFGSCRTAAPHDPPWSLELANDARGRGVDALYAHALRMLDLPQEEWPDLAVFLGDQVYADESSPETRAKVIARRAHDGSTESDLPDDHVEGFEEYCWLYHESWGSEVERWFFSVVPSVMIFDDHDMIDDWNISESWVRDTRERPWWPEHVRGAMMSYWVYQHLGNMSPEEIRRDGMLARLTAVPDGTALLRAWADRAEETAGAPGSYRFSFVRDVGGVRLVMVDVRHSRVLTPDCRRLVADHEWEWVRERCLEPSEHLLIGSSLPVFVPPGLHDLQRWNDILADGRWGRLVARGAEGIRRGLDLEDWPSFGASFDSFVELLCAVGGRPRGEAPRTVSVLSGDIHLSYISRLHFRDEQTMTSSVHQIVNSPIRNALNPKERLAMRAAMSRTGALVARGLRRTVARRHVPLTWKIDQGPVFDNCLGQLLFDGSSARLVQEHSCPSDDGSARLDLLYDVDLTTDEVSGVGSSTRVSRLRGRNDGRLGTGRRARSR